MPGSQLTSQGPKIVATPTVGNRARCSEKENLTLDFRWRDAVAGYGLRTLGVWGGGVLVCF